MPPNREASTANQERLLALRRLSSSFPEDAAVAEFRPRSQTIHLNRITRATLRDSLASEVALAGNRREWQTVVHELTHWVDLCTTLWGRRYLSSLLRAYAGIEGSEDAYWTALEHYDEDRRILFPEYYHYVLAGSSKHSPDRPWSIGYSAGREFSADGRINEDRPIFFTTFGDHDSRANIARQPLSVGSLLEIRAVHAETITGIGLVALMGEGALVESAIYSREASALHYDPERTAYTAPVHLLSVRANTIDPVRSYRIASELAYLALNLTDDALRQLRHPDSFEPFGDMREQFIRSRNYGYAFACMAFNAPQDAGEDPETFVDQTLAAAGLPTSDEILAQAARACAAETLLTETPAASMVNSMLAEAENLVPHLERSKAYSVDLQLTITQPGKFPPLVDMNGDIFSFSGNKLGTHDPVQMMDHEARLQNFLSSFLPASRGMR